MPITNLSFFTKNLQIKNDFVLLQNKIENDQA